MDPEKPLICLANKMKTEAGLYPVILVKTPGQNWEKLTT